MMGRNLENRRQLSIIDLYESHIRVCIQVCIRVCIRVHLPDRNGDWVTGELSRGNELPNVFLEGPRWFKPLHENILKAGQHFCPNDFLQAGRDTWHKVLGEIEILYRRERE